MSECPFKIIWKEKTKEIENLIDKDSYYWRLRYTMANDLMIKKMENQTINYFEYEEEVNNLYDEFKQDKLKFENFLDFQKKWEKNIGTKEYFRYLENLRNEELEQMIGEELDKEI